MQTYIPDLASKGNELLKQSLHDDPSVEIFPSSSSALSLPAHSESQAYIIPCPNPHHPLSFTGDGWTGADHESYICVTAHWLDLDWEMRYVLLDVILCTDTHTGENLKEWMLQELIDYHIFVCISIFVFAFALRFS